VKAQHPLRIKRIVLLAGMALAAVAAMAPASASAEATWTHDFEQLKKDAKVELSGRAGIVIPGVAGYDCIMHASLTLKGNSSTGTVDSLTITTSTCTGTGLLAGCGVKKDTAEELPWSIHVTTEADAVIKDIKFQFTFDEFCAAKENVTSFLVSTAVPDNAGSITTLTLSGTSINGTILTGVLTMAPKETYGVEA